MAHFKLTFALVVIAAVALSALAEEESILLQRFRRQSSWSASSSGRTVSGSYGPRGSYGVVTSIRGGFGGYGGGGGGSVSRTDGLSARGLISSCSTTDGYGVCGSN